MKEKFKIQNVQQLILLLYYGVMLGIFPIFYRHQYAGMGTWKYIIFQFSTFIFLVAMGISLLVYYFKYKKEIVFEKKSDKTILDYAILIFFICNTISYFFSINQTTALKGAGGWYTGFLMHLLLVGIFIVISKTTMGNGAINDTNNENVNILDKYKIEKMAINILLFSSFLVFLIAILHRFNVDPLNIYGNLEIDYRIKFLSTIGQASWYSSFLCTVWPVGLYLFFTEVKINFRVLYGIYTAVGAMSLVTQNSDTAYFSLLVILILLIYIAQKQEEMKRFLETVMLIFGSFILMGVLQVLFIEKMIPLDGLSIFMSQGIMSPFILLVAFVLYLGLIRGCTKIDEFLKNRNLFKIIINSLVAIIFLTIILIIINTSGVLQEWFGFQINNNYILFNDKWGNLRGFSWRNSVNCFASFPFYRKLIGVGQDCFSIYYQSIPELNQCITEFFDGLVLTNSHNEYLTKLINTGIIGLVSYLFVLLAAVYQFLKGAKDYKVLALFSLVTVSYMAHLIFCYEQVCCTPIFFILIAIGNKIYYMQNIKQCKNEEKV